MTDSSLPTVAFLGAGNMGGALIDGMLAAGAPHGELFVTNLHRSAADRFDGIDGVTSLALEETPDANATAVETADVVVIGVKPSMVPDLLAEIAPHLKAGVIVVSFAAGVTIATFEAALPDGTAVVRTMPNTPAAVGEGMTALVQGSAASDADLALVSSLFEKVGKVVVVHEDQIDAVTAISGSGPAYVFQLIEDFTKAAQAQGFDAEQAATLAEQTFIGATALLRADGRTPTELRLAVTSPKGTTEQGVNVLQAAHLDEVFTAATDAARKRAEELAAGV